MGPRNIFHSATTPRSRSIAFGLSLLCCESRTLPSEAVWFSSGDTIDASSVLDALRKAETNRVKGRLSLIASHRLQRVDYDEILS